VSHGTSNTPSLHPDAQRLRERATELRSALREAAERGHRMSTQERPRLLALYDELFGELERELQDLALRCAELGRRVELLTVKVARGESITPEIVDLVNKVVDKEYARFHQRLREAFDMTSSQREDIAQARLGAEPDTELVDMYRTAVKRLHPDVAKPSAEDAELWHRLQDAWEQRDASKLRTIVTMLGADEPDADVSANRGIDELQRDVEQLEAKLRAEERKIRRMEGQEPFVFASEINNEAWKRNHRAELETSIAAKKKELDDHKRNYRDLAGGDIAEGTDLRPKEDVDFNKDFRDNTYFNNR